jgi:hypothetical protein
MLICSFTLVGFAAMAQAHHPNRECRTVKPRIDVIGPLGNNFRPSYRREMNRPRYLGGLIAYKIAPSSQEAMAWHLAEHKGAYASEAGRIEPHYFYRKPWEALKVGPRRSAVSDASPSLQPLAEGESVPVFPNTDATVTAEPEDSMAFADKEDQSDIIDTPAPDLEDDGQMLPEPPSSPSDIFPEPKREEEVEDAIGSGLQKVKERLKFSSPR